MSDKHMIEDYKPSGILKKSEKEKENLHFF